MFDLSVFFSVENLLQIAFLWVIAYWVLRYLETTLAGAFLRSLGVFAVFAVLVLMRLFDWLELDALRTIFQYLIIFVFLSAVIVFQPELRHGLTRLNRSPLARMMRRFGLKPEEAGTGVVDEVLKAARRFSKHRVGSMVVIERDISLQPFIDRAVRVDAAVRAELLDTIFTTPTLLHDGAVIMRGDRLEAAGAVLPLTQNPDIPKRYGTRHRAAIGISEDSDAVVVVTSEETGAISLVWAGVLHPQEDTVKTEETLNKLLSGEDVDVEEKAKA